MEQLIAGVREDIESFAAELGLTIIQRVMEAEIEQKVGQWGQQAVWRHGQQPGPARGTAFQLQGFSEQRQAPGGGRPAIDAAMLDA